MGTQTFIMDVKKVGPENGTLSPYRIFLWRNNTPTDTIRMRTKEELRDAVELMYKVFRNKNARVRINWLV